MNSFTNRENDVKFKSSRKCDSTEKELNDDIFDFHM